MIVKEPVRTATRRRSSEGDQGALKQGERPLIGVIGSPHGSPQIKAWPAVSPTTSCSDIEVDYTPRTLRNVPEVALPMQHSLLKRISAFQNKEELLEFVAHYHMLLDPINLVTCLYRLAKMSKEASRGRGGYLAELQRNPTFQLLLRSISSKFLQGHLSFLHNHSEGLKGVDGRCLANLTWALAKLDLSSDDCALTTELALTVAPFIIRSLDTSSPQGLANMLWSYAKLPVAPPAVVAALVSKITDQLVLQAQRPDGASTFDAQALSNSIWALAHLKSRGMDVDATRAPNVMRFLNELAGAAARALARHHASCSPPGTLGELRLADAQRYLGLVEREFSCQALVNIAWSFATLLGVGCGQQPPIHQLFLLIHAESLTRLRCTALTLRGGHSLPYVGGGGGFNEQALSNAVYAFDKVGLLSTELLNAVFEVSALRLQRGWSSAHPDHLASFKPQELCTLLKACHTKIAPPWVFLGSLLQLLSAHPGMAECWSAAERLELHRACQLYLAHQSEAVSAAATQGGIWGGNLAVSAAMGLANTIANSMNVSAAAAAGGALPSPSSGSGRPSYTGSSLPPPSPVLSGQGGSIFSSRRLSAGSTGGGGGVPGVVASSPPGPLATGSFFGSSSLGEVARAAGGGGPRGSSSSGAAVGPGGPAGVGMGFKQALHHHEDPLTSTFGRLPLPEMQQQVSMPHHSVAASAALAALPMSQPPVSMAASCLVGGGSPAVNCPICGLGVRQVDALAHIENCLQASKAAASNVQTAAATLYRQQQQQAAAAQQHAAIAARFAAAQQEQQLHSLLASQLLLQQHQHNGIGMASQQQQQGHLAGGGVLGFDDLCRPAGAVDAAALTPWMMEAAVAARPPLRPARRL